MRPLSLAAILAVAALWSATDAFAQEVLEEETGSTAAPEQISGIDWSVGLRGSYAANSLTGGKPSASLTPEVSLTLGGESSVTTYGAGSELIVDGAGQARVADVHAGVTSSLRLGATTNLAGSINGKLTQLDPSDSSLPVNTLIAPLVLDGTAQGIATQDLGHVDATLTLDGKRLVTGPTTLADLSTVDNSDKSYWQGGATLRLGYELTPLLSTFVEGEASVQKFDAPDPTLLKYLDGRTYQLRAGVSFVQGSMISVEASIGRGWLDYVDGTITDTQDWVYNGSVTVRPDETVSLTGALETTLGPSTNVPGDTDVGYLLSGTARYEVNPWLTLRATSSWDRTVTLGTGDESWGLDAGVGLDYRSSRHIVWSADYAYARDYAPPTPLNDTHTVSVGVRVNR
ncbi:MAG: outer membrane beta-barrel protein [Devosia sp.]